MKPTHAQDLTIWRSEWQWSFPFPEEASRPVNPDRMHTRAGLSHGKALRVVAKLVFVKLHFTVCVSVHLNIFILFLLF